MPSKRAAVALGVVVLALSGAGTTAVVADGGLGSISEQLLDTRPDVTLGGGSATFAETATAGKWAGKTLEQQAKERGYNYLTAKSDLAGVASADQKRPLLGLFSSGNMPVKFAPPARTATPW